jgi:Putative translation initiation inhibitor, yjgF family
VSVIEGDGVVLLSVRAEGVRELDDRGTSARVTETYRTLFAALAKCRARNPVRFWNHIPGLHDRVGPGLDRYMAFNAGRFAAMQEWFGGVDQVRRCVATASGIGHSGDDLFIHCLASVSAGTPVENPRQIPSYLYSRRFGPTPPCFARATIAELRGERLLLVAGTASIRGEESVHIGDLGAQLHETLINLRAVIARAGVDEAAALDRLREVRVYHPRPVDREFLEGACARAFRGAAEIEVQRADLCRSELLVEIEGTVRLQER